MEKKETGKEQLVSEITEKIANEHGLIYSGGMFYGYRVGCYHPIEEMEIINHIHRILGALFRVSLSNEVLATLQASRFVRVSELNKSDDLNLKNCMLHVSDEIPYPHHPELYSTIQLDVNYDPETPCPMWIRVLNEIFQGDEDKIELLQEFFGLCLIKENRYEKCLFLLGEGANGKSVVLYVLQHLVGKQNYSAIPLERFDNRHYLAELFGKLVNISIETNAKSSVYDSTLKAIITGDLISADVKFKPPFSFNPFCKLIFALNNMPRVDDKSHGFFRRILILEFRRRFAEHEQNKNLKYELVETELNGIFNWCLEGLQRLSERGYFAPSESIQASIEEYREENNSILIFVQELCILGPEYQAAKDELYVRYQAWCKENGNQPLSKIRFGKEVCRQFPAIRSGREAATRSWEGIGIC